MARSIKQQKNGHNKPGKIHFWFGEVQHVIRSCPRKLSLFLLLDADFIMPHEQHSENLSTAFRWNIKIPHHLEKIFQIKHSAFCTPFCTPYFKNPQNWIVVERFVLRIHGWRHYGAKNVWSWVASKWRSNKKRRCTKSLQCIMSAVFCGSLQM